MKDRYSTKTFSNLHMKIKELCEMVDIYMDFHYVCKKRNDEYRFNEG